MLGLRDGRGKHVQYAGMQRLLLVTPRMLIERRVVINPNDLQRIYTRDMPESNIDPTTSSSSGPPPKSTRVIEYNSIDGKLFEEIQGIQSIGNYGSKIQAIVRHLLYLQVKDPGSKSIVFSAWADSLYSKFGVLIEQSYADALVANVSIHCAKFWNTH